GRARGRAGDAARPGPSRRPRPPPARDAGARQGTSGDPAVTLPGPPQARMLAVAGVFAGLLALIVLRAVDLTVLRGPELARLAALQHRARIALTSQLGLKGVYTVQEGRRFYPHHGLAAHVLGFVGVDSQGLEGLERRLDPVIRGQPRDVEADRDGRRQVIFTAGVPVPPAQGSRVEL